MLRILLTMAILFGTASIVRADVPVPPNVREMVTTSPVAVVIAGIAAMFAIGALGLWAVKKQNRGDTKDQ